MRAPECVDCIEEGVTTWRPITSGKRKKRCATHAKALVKRSRINAHARMVQNGYGITPEQYWALYEAQGSRCAICQVATGKVKRLAVDHDHVTGEVRGLLCGVCNQLLGRYPPVALVRALTYLHDPPARRVLRNPAGVTSFTAPYPVPPGTNLTIRAVDGNP